jgi:hypothetical protein
MMDLTISATELLNCYGSGESDFGELNFSAIDLKEADLRASYETVFSPSKRLYLSELSQA